MPSAIGKQAVVVGAGMAGLTGAAAVAPYFERVVVLDLDALPTEPANRPGTPQAKHVHALLAGGQRALGELFPGFERDLERAGAVAIQAGLDLRMERPGYDPFPQRDLGFHSYAMSRALVEFVTRKALHAYSNVEIRERCRVEALTVDAVGGAVRGVRAIEANGARHDLVADLVLDASGRGDPTLKLLDTLGVARPSATTIGVDIAYSTAIFAIPDDAPKHWKGVFHLPMPPNSHGALLLPLEGRRWIVTLAGRHGDDPPGDEAGFMAVVKGFRMPTIYEALRSAKRQGDIARYRFSESAHRHYEHLDAFPPGLLPIGDALCRFNPVWGQGMSVAAQQACALRRLLGDRIDEPDALRGLARAFFAEANGLIATPWAQAAVPDFIHPATRGERPANFEQSLKFGLALTKLAARDPAVHKLTAEVGSLLKPRTAYMDPQLMQRVMAVMAEGS